MRKLPLALLAIGTLIAVVTIVRLMVVLTDTRAALKRANGAWGACDTERDEAYDQARSLLQELAENKAAHEAEEARRDEHLRKASESGSLLCQIEMTAWTARIEGAAGVPEMTLRKVVDAQHGIGKEPKISKDQARKLLAAVDRWPPPVCADAGVGVR